MSRSKRKMVNIVACVLFIGEGNAIKRVELSEIKNTRFRLL